MSPPRSTPEFKFVKSPNEGIPLPKFQHIVSTNRSVLLNLTKQINIARRWAMPAHTCKPVLNRSGGSPVYNKTFTIK